MIHPVVVNPVLSPVVRVTDPVRWRAGKLAPEGAILHWDADLDAFAEQTGGPHTFNHAVLSPQYQRNADGSYSNVGAKPAVDVFGGEKWLRTCGVITNLFGGDTSIARSVTLTAQSYTLQVFGAGTATCSYGTATVSTPLTFTATAGATTFTPTGATRWMLTATAYPVPYVPPGVTQPASNATTTNGMWFANPAGSELWKSLDGDVDGVELVANGGFDTDIAGWSVGNPGASTLSWVGGRIRITRAQVGDKYPNARCVLSGLTVGARYLIVSKTSNPYGIETYHSIAGISASLVKITSPIAELRSEFVATNTTHNLDVGIWSTSGSLGQYVEFDNISIQRIQPQPLTLATRVRMGVGSGDIGAASDGIAIVSSKTSILGSEQRSKTPNYIILCNDGSITAATATEWPRNAVIRRITQVNTACTQYRVGYMIEGTHTTIQWGSWVNYDGSFDPSTLYRLMLGYNNAYPMWFNKITAWKKQATDAEILEAMA